MFCKYRIVLSVDGAGIKGLIPLKIMDYLHQSISTFDKDIDVTSWVDVFASTSASSIFTGALMLKDENNRTKHTPKEILDFYMKRGTQIFSQNTGVDPEHSAYPLSFTLDHFFGDVNMLDLRNHFMFLSYNLTKDEIFPFSNTMDRFHNLSLAKVMNACSAVPNIYPPLKLGNVELCDALFKIQNPAVYAYNYARLFYPNDHLVFISIGTGENEMQKLAQVEEAHLELEQITEHDDKLLYYRFQPKLHESFDVTDSSQKQIDHLIEVTEEYIFQNMSLFNELLHLMAMKAA